jgi:hypothetical protein
MLDARDAEIAHGYCLADLKRFAGYAMHNTYWQRAMSVKDRYEIALSAIAEYLCQSEYRPEEKELVRAGRRAINRDVAARMKLDGVDASRRADEQGPNMARFCTYWWPYASSVGSHENGIVDVIAVSQILPQLKPVHQQALLALAVHGTYDKGAASIGRSSIAFRNLVYRARKEFLTLWHECEQPSRIWGKDLFGIEGYDRKENITSITLGQRKRKRKKRAESNGHPGNT